MFSTHMAEYIYGTQQAIAFDLKAAQEKHIQLELSIFIFVVSLTKNNNRCDAESIISPSRIYTAMQDRTAKKSTKK